MSTKTAMVDPGLKYWKVTSNSVHDGRFTKTRFIGVVAKDVASVVQEVLAKYPDNIIVSINHEGPVDVLTKE